MKEVTDIIGPVLTEIWNTETKSRKIFPKNLKLADVTPVFKKDDNTLVKNYRPVSILPTVLKVF